MIRSVVRLLFALMLFSVMMVVLTSVATYGGRRLSWQADVETQIITFFLRQKSYQRGSASGRVALVEVTDQSATQSVLGLRDAPWEHYEAAIRRAVDTGAELVLLALANHDYFAQALDLRRSLGGRFHIAIRQVFFHRFSAEELERDEIKNLDDCSNAVQSYCSHFSVGWNYRVVTFLERRLLQNMPKEKLSSELPHFYPNFLVHIPEHFQGSRLQIATARNEDFAGKYVFIGNSVIQGEELGSDRYAHLRSRIPKSPFPFDLRTQGVPIHEFWAMLADAWLLDRIPSITQTTLIQVLVGVFCLAIGMTFYFVSPVIGALVFVGGGLSFFVVNFLLFEFFDLYTPVFSVLWSGSMILMASIVFQVFWRQMSNFKDAHVTARYQRESVLQSNLLAVMSHNLNTPVAQLRALADLEDDAKRRRATFDLHMTVRSLLGGILRQSKERRRVVSIQQLEGQIISELRQNADWLSHNLTIEYVGNESFGSILVDERLIVDLAASLVFGSRASKFSMRIRGNMWEWEVVSDHPMPLIVETFAKEIAEALVFEGKTIWSIQLESV